MFVIAQMFVVVAVHGVVVVVVVFVVVVFIVVFVVVIVKEWQIIVPFHCLMIYRKIFGKL